MLSSLRNKEQKNSAEDSNNDMASQSDLTDSPCMETSDDVVTAGSKQWMSHRDIYEFVKNRTYSTNKPARAQLDYEFSSSIPELQDKLNKTFSLIVKFIVLVQ